MQLAAVIGSPHGMKGNTGALLQAALDGAAAAGAEVRVFSLAELEVAPCTACNVCHRKGECSIRDGFQAIRDGLAGADMIVLASPNYIFSVSAQMKALLDRCCGPLHCQAWVGKYGGAIVSAGGGGCEEVAQYIVRFLRAMGCRTTGGAGATAQALADPASRQAALDAAARLGRELVAAARARKEFPDQAADREAFFARMKALVTARREEWPHEYRHWQKQGWI